MQQEIKKMEVACLILVSVFFVFVISWLFTHKAPPSPTPDLPTNTVVQEKGDISNQDDFCLLHDCKF